MGLLSNLFKKDTAFFEQVCNIVDTYGTREWDEYGYDGSLPHEVVYSCGDVDKDISLSKIKVVGGIGNDYVFIRIKEYSAKIYGTSSYTPPANIQYIVDNYEKELANNRKKLDQSKLLQKEEKQRQKDATSRSQHIIKALNFLGEYADGYLRIGYTTEKKYENYIGYETIVVNRYVLLHKSNTVVYRIGENSESVDIYRPGKWEEYLMNVYNERYTRFKKKQELKKLEEELKKAQIEKTEKQKQLKYERERYLPIDE